MYWILKAVALILLLQILDCQSTTQTVTWMQTPLIKSGEHKLLLQGEAGPATKSYTQTYFQTFTAIPSVALGMIDIEASGISFSLMITNVTTTRFTTVLSLPSGTAFGLLIYMYIAIQSDPQLYTSIYPLSSTAFTPSLCNSFPLTTVSPFDLTHVNVIIPYIASFSMTANPNYSITVTASVTNVNTLTVQVCSNATVTAVQLFMVVVDQTALQSTYKTYLDVGVYEVFNSGVSSTNSFIPPISGYNYFNSIIGLNQFRSRGGQRVSILALQSTVTTNTSFDQAAFGIIAWRVRNCVTLRYYFKSQQSCYAVCPAVTATDSLNNACVSCQSGCNTCVMNANNIGTQCTDCLSSSFRTLTMGVCQCVVGYFDSGYAVCSQCSYVCVQCNTVLTRCTQCDPSRTLSSSNTCDCNARLFDAGIPACQPCVYSCLTCASASTTCTSCNAAMNRILSNNQCLCVSGYQDVSSAELCTLAPFVCAASCLTCSMVSNNCTACNSTLERELSSNRCGCIVGFREESGVCVEVCGDGVRKYEQCDDGNTRSGDGCSSACTVEVGFVCTGGLNAPSVCVNGGGYSASVSHVVRNTFDNYFTVTVDITPPPPVGFGVGVNFSDMQVKGYTLQSSPLGSGSMSAVIDVNFTNNHYRTEVLGLHLLGVNINVAAPLIMSNLRPMAVYSSQQITIHGVQVILVYVYVGLLWVGSLFLWIFVDWKLISGIIELYAYSAMVYVGYLGLPLIGIFYDSLSNLGYCFGFNLSLSKSVLGVLNVGLVLNILPLIVYLILVLVGKYKPDAVTLDTKRMFLFDGVYFWCFINAFLVVYGLSSALKSSFTVFSIIGVVFGLIYLCLYVLLSLYFFRGEQTIVIKLARTKTNAFKPKFLPICYSILLGSQFVYLCIPNMLNIIVLIGATIIMSLMIVFGNFLINKARNLLNLVSLLLIYGCMLLYNEVPSAEWSGFLVVGLMFLQLGLNFVFMYTESKKMTYLEGQNVSGISSAKPADQLLANEFSIYDPAANKTQFLRPVVNVQNQQVTKKKNHLVLEDDFITPVREVYQNQHQLSHDNHEEEEEQKHKQKEENYKYNTVLKTFDQQNLQQNLRGKRNNKKRDQQDNQEPSIHIDFKNSFLQEPQQANNKRQQPIGRNIQQNELTNQPSRVSRKLFQTQKKYQPLLNLTKKH